MNIGWKKLLRKVGCCFCGEHPSHLPGPEPAKAGTMPGHDGFRFDDGQCRTPIAPDAGQSDLKQAIRWDQLRAFSRGPLKDADLVAQSQVLQLEGSARMKDRE
jgi:hypothetical protein